MSANDSAMADLETRFNILHQNTDSFFLIVIGILVFLMQCGFAFLEAGAVRTKNTVNILIKNMLDALIGGVSYYMVGWAVAYGPGGNGFIGGSNFFSYGMDYSSYPSWFFQFVFAATATTILSGAIAERTQFTAYFAYSILITGKNKTLCIVNVVLKLNHAMLKSNRLGISPGKPLGLGCRHSWFFGDFGLPGLCWKWGGPFVWRSVCFGGMYFDGSKTWPIWTQWKGNDKELILCW